MPADRVAEPEAELAPVLALLEEVEQECAQQREGDAGAVILAEADRWNADLLVVGRPVRTAIAGPAPGGVATHLLEFADVPVLAIP